MGLAPARRRRRRPGCLWPFVVFLLVLAAAILFDARRRPLPADGRDARGEPLVPVASDPSRIVTDPAFRYTEVFEGTVTHLFEYMPRVGGDWAFDYGDAPGWAPTLGYLMAAETGDARYAQEAKAVLDRQVTLIERFDPADLSEISFGAFGLIAGARQAGPEDRGRYRAALARYLDRAVVLAVADRYYLDLVDAYTGGGGYEYGATTLTCHVALSLMAAGDTVFEQRPFFDYASTGIRMVDAVIRRAWDEAGGFVYGGVGDTQMRALPNGIFIMAALQAYRLTGDEEYLRRACTVAGAFHRLHDAERGGYFAPAEYVGVSGARDYKSLSTNSYPAKGFSMLYRATGDRQYLDMADDVFTFIARDLTADGIVYHHWFEGRRATGDIYCPGCQFRIATYVYEYNRVRPPAPPEPPVSPEPPVAPEAPASDAGEGV